MTEEEAKTKVCPVAKMRGSFDGNWDKGGCIGSACMAWRWNGAYPLADDPPEIRNRYDGHCGLAGKP